VGLAETRLSCKAGAGEAAEIDATKKFETEEFVEILEIHWVALILLPNHIILQDEH
jgi:hypothetical protein